MFICWGVSTETSWSLLCWCVSCSTKEKSTKNSIVVEMKSENNEEAVLLQGVNGEKKLPNDQVTIVTRCLATRQPQHCVTTR